jgi:hypothetical protein
MWRPRRTRRQPRTWYPPGDMNPHAAEEFYGETPASASLWSASAALPPTSHFVAIALPVRAAVRRSNRLDASFDVIYRLAYGRPSCRHRRFWLLTAALAYRIRSLPPRAGWLTAAFTGVAVTTAAHAVWVIIVNAVMLAQDLTDNGPVYTLHAALRPASHLDGMPAGSSPPAPSRRRRPRRSP